MIAEFTVVGKEDPDGKIGKALAQMLQARLREVTLEIQDSQLELIDTTESDNRFKHLILTPEMSAEPKAIKPEEQKPPITTRELSGIAGSVRVPESVPIWNAGGIELGTRLLDAPALQVSVSGVDVGGVIHWLNRQLASNRTLHFTYYENSNKQVHVSGDLAAVDVKGALRLEMETKPPETDVSLSLIAERMAYEILRQRLGRDSNNKVEILQPDEFPILVQVLRDAAKHRRSASMGRNSQAGFTKSLQQITPLAGNVPGWYQLQLLAATLADRPGNTSKHPNSTPPPCLLWSAIANKERFQN